MIKSTGAVFPVEPVVWVAEDEQGRLEVDPIDVLLAVVVAQVEEDLERVFNPNWLFAVHGAQLPNVGDYVTLSVGRDPLLLVRGHDGVVRGFYNSCRHRGSIICADWRGNARKGS